MRINLQCLVHNIKMLFDSRRLTQRVKQYQKRNQICHQKFTVQCESRVRVFDLTTVGVKLNKQKKRNKTTWNSEMRHTVKGRSYRHLDRDIS